MVYEKHSGPAIDWIKPSKSALVGIVLSVLLAVAGYWASASYNDTSWLPRAGALIVIIGLLFESFPLLKVKYGDDASYWTTKDGPTNARWRVLIIIVGTVIWAFGDRLV